MERIGYFRSANPFNITWNWISGNDFPLSEEKINPGLFLFMWIVFVWLIKITCILAIAIGSFYLADLTAEEAFKMSGVASVVCLEMTIPTLYLNLQRKNLCKLIRKYNNILIDSDELRALIHGTVKPYTKGLKVYVFACLAGGFTWATAPLIKIFHNDQFSYVDFIAPAYFPGEPFGRNVFIAGVLFQTFGACVVNLGKVAVDIYVSYFILVLTAEFKYIREQVANAVSPEKDQEDERSIIIALHNCVRHHTAVIEISKELTEILAFHIGATYFSYILKFCFLALGVATVGSVVVEKISYVVYGSACLIQTYVFCSCIQELFDESTSVTEDAFHENWHVRSSAVKKTFCMMELSNHIACRPSAYGVVDLIVPTLAVILSKSYSVYLLLLEAN